MKYLKYLKWIIIASLFLTTFLIGRRTSSPAPSLKIQTDTVYVQKAPPKLTPTTPERITVYRTEVKVDTVRVPVPYNMNIGGIITEKPVKVNRRSVVLRSFNPLYIILSGSEVYSATPKVLL